MDYWRKLCLEFAMSQDGVTSGGDSFAGGVLLVFPPALLIT